MYQNRYTTPWLSHPWQVYYNLQHMFPECVTNCDSENAVSQLCIRRTSGNCAELKARRAAKQINLSSSLWTQTPGILLTMNTSRAVLRWRHRSKKKKQQPWHFGTFVMEFFFFFFFFYNLSSLKNVCQAIHFNIFQLGFSFSSWHR